MLLTSSASLSPSAALSVDHKADLTMVGGGDECMGETTPILKSGSSFRPLDTDEDHPLPPPPPPQTQGLSRRTSFHRTMNSQDTWLSGGIFSKLGGGGGYRGSRRARFKNGLLVCYLAVSIWTLLIICGPMLLALMEKEHWCDLDEQRNLKSSYDQSGNRFINNDMSVDEKHYDNPDYNTDPCRYMRLPWILWLTLEECDYCQRMLVSVLLGGSIGYERRSSDRPAGIRTMGLVSLGACFFTISSITAFKSSTMGWDSSRVTAALPSGVGFLGAALIWKGTVNVESQDMHQVHGLTTAASVWLSAAIGVGAGGALYFVSVYSTVLILMVLRFGPKLYLQEDEDDEGDEEDDEPMDEADDDRGGSEMEWKEPEPKPAGALPIGTEISEPVTFNKAERQSSSRAKRRVPTFHG